MNFEKMYTQKKIIQHLSQYVEQHEISYQQNATFLNVPFVTILSYLRKNGKKMGLTVITPSFIIVFLLRIIIPTTFFETFVGIFLSIMSYRKMSHCKHLNL
jgi:hypothetical protein